MIRLNLLRSRVYKSLLCLFAFCLLIPVTPSPAYPPLAGFQDHMDSYDTARWDKAHCWSNSPSDPNFNVDWCEDHIAFVRWDMSQLRFSSEAGTSTDGVLRLQLDNTPCPSTPAKDCSTMPYTSGEYRTDAKYGYGKFETFLMAARGSGVLTTFFTYNGSPHDEIDIEIFGKDTTTMQVNYFASNQGHHEKVIQLGFDAADAFHKYGFMWTPTSIEWFVDNVSVHRVDASQGSIPQTAGQIMVNLWAGADLPQTINWLGQFTYPGRPIFAHCSWVSYTPRRVVFP